MKAFCSYCGKEFFIDNIDFIALFESKRDVYCSNCANKETVGCYRCIHFKRMYDSDYCGKQNRDGSTDIYCKKMEAI